jgi:serine phosphatase RsbU (regulator of sigma subunit)
LRRRRARLLLAALTGAALSSAAPLDPAAPVVDLTPESLNRGIRLEEGWRYQPGDDPTWASPSFDDRAWPVASSLITDPASLPGGWPGIGWFRRSVSLARGMGQTVVGLYVDQMGASEVYLDGRLVAHYGTVSSSGKDERAFFPRRFTAVVLEPGPGHVLAVRYSNEAGNALNGRRRGFLFYLRTVEGMSLAATRLVLAVAAVTSFFAGSFAAFAILYGLFWAFRPKSRENLYFALFTGFITANFAVELWVNLAEDPARALLALGVLFVTAVGFVVSGLALEHSFFGVRPSWWTYVICGSGVAMLVWISTWRHVRPILLPQIYILVGAAEMLRIAVRATLRRQRDAWIVAAGLGTLTVAVLLNQLAQILDLARLPTNILFICALVVLVFAVTVYLSRRVTRTQRELEERLVQVHELTTRAVEQERRAAAEEAERRILAAENDRKTRELEDARQMQLAMLPPSPPSHGRFDIAFRMATATEVGGDYVDFAPCRGGLQVGVGDATSHGLQAGIVVAVAKSLFQTSREEPGPSVVLGRVADGLAALRERRASMALAVLRLDGSTVRFASAGMPPLLVFRKDGARTEEVLLPGMPLGTMRETPWEEREIRLATGDAVLAMTDGLAESVDSAGEQFGYDRAAALFASLADRDAAGIVDGMLAGAVSFLRGAGLEDDFTVVALKVR